MSVVLCVASILVAQPTGDQPLDYGQFVSIMRGLYGSIQNFELICEGEIRFVDESAPNRTGNGAMTDKKFQSNYLYDFNHDTYLDIYMKEFGQDTSMSRSISVLRGDGKLTELIHPAGRRPPRFPSVSNGGPGSMDPEGSPERFMFFYYINSIIDYPESYSFDNEGWDTIDGQRCIRIKISEFPGINAYRLLWIDLERGGHVIQSEYHRKGELWNRVHNVILKQMPLPDGNEVWFPVYGEFDSFLNGDRFQGDPVIHESYGVVRGSLVFNQNLPDDRFSVHWKGGPKIKTPGIREAEKEFARTPPEPDPPMMRMDPAGVQEDLERMLAEADSQSSRLEASSPARAWSSKEYLPLYFLALGAILLGGTAYWCWKMR